MKSCKKFLALLLSLTLAVALLAGLGPAALAGYDNVEEAQHSVVRVYCIVSEDYYGLTLSTGSGFAVGKAGDSVSYIVTNHHVVESNFDEIYVTTTDFDGGIHAKVVDYDANIDYAILKLETSLKDRVPMPLLSPKELHKSQDVYCIGFPGLSDDYTQDDTLASRIEDMTITKGTVSNPQYDFDGTECVMSDVKANPGNSGGPMVDEYGRAVGINTTVIGLDKLNNMTLAVSMDYIIQRLDALGIDYISAGSKPSEDTAPPEVQTDKSGKEDESKDKDADEGKEKLNLSTETLAILGAALVVVAAVVVILILVKKSKRKPVTAGASTGVGTVIAPQNPGNRFSDGNGGGTIEVPFSGRLVVECVRGPICGQRASGSSVRVGRSAADCDLAFPSDSHGVSRKHCVVQAGPNGILLRDLGSSYGTILSDGRSLPSGGSTVIRSGDVVYLGSEKVAIRVTMMR